MNPFLFSCLLFLGILNQTAGQSSLPEFGTITDAEWKMTECAFDKDADAIILLDEASSDYDQQYQLITNRRIRIKILKPGGIALADVRIPFYSGNDFEYIGDIEANVYNYNPGGEMKVQAVNRAQIFRQKVNEIRSVVKFAMPDVKVGSILEYKYSSTKKSYTNGLESWYFQDELPTLFSNYSLVILPNAQFAYVVHKSEELPIDIKNEKGSGKIQFEMKNIPGLRDEPYMDAKRDYIQYVEFQLASYTGQFGGTTRYMSNWEEVTRTLMLEPAFGKQLNKKLPGSDNLLNSVKLISPPAKKMAAIYYYVQKNIAWNEFIGIYSGGVKEAWEKKKGTNADLNMILINLLQEAGLDAYPLLVSERGYGKVNPTTPFVDQFNTVMAYVMIGNKSYVLDVASSYSSPYVIPLSVVNTTAFIVDRKKGGIITLTENDHMEKNQVIIRAKVNEEGKMQGTATIYSYDYSRVKRERSYRRDKDRFSNTYLLKHPPGIKIGELVISDLDNDSIPMEQKFDFELPPVVTGDYRLVNLNLFTGFETNPFIADNRFTNIDYGCLQRHILSEIIELPDNLQPESLPGDVKLIMPDKSISLTRIIQFADNKISTRYEIQMSRSVFTPDEYRTIKEFYKKMIDIMNEQVVLRKKS